MLIRADLETSRKETKVRLRGHELRQAHHSSAKAKQEEIRIIRAFPCTAGSGGDNRHYTRQTANDTGRPPPPATADDVETIAATFLFPEGTLIS